MAGIFALWIKSNPQIAATIFDILEKHYGKYRAKICELSVPKVTVGLIVFLKTIASDENIPCTEYLESFVELMIDSAIEILDNSKTGKCAVNTWLDCEKHWNRFQAKTKHLVNDTQAN